MYNYAFNDRLQIRSPADHRILLTEPPLNPSENRRRMHEVMLEKYGFNGCKVQIQALLVLYAQGLITGVVVDSGDGVTHIVPVRESCCHVLLLSHLSRHADGVRLLSRLWSQRQAEANIRV